MNQSSVKPRQGGAGYGASLKANTATTSSGRNRKAKNSSAYTTVRGAQPGGAGQGRDHVRRITSPNCWPDSFRPTQTMALDSTSSRKPKAAPCSQLKRVMNWV